MTKIKLCLLLFIVMFIDIILYFLLKLNTYYYNRDCSNEK